MSERSPYSASERLLSLHPDADEKQLVALLTEYMQNAPERSLIIARWCRTAVSLFLSRKRLLPTPDYSEPRAAIARGIRRAFDLARLPDGRLFADVPIYEYAELKQTFRGWVALIEWVERYARVNDNTLTARDIVKPADFDERFKVSGLEGFAP